MTHPTLRCFHGPHFLTASGRWHRGGLLVRGASIAGESQNGDDVPASQRERLPEGFAFPGFIDSHAHLSRLGSRPDDVSLSPHTTLAEVLEVVATRALQQKGRAEDWICGRGWLYLGEEKTPPQPTGALLDQVSPLVPVALKRALWVNSAALRRANITAQTPDPSGGHIVRDAAGQPTGLLIDAAMGFVTGLIPPPSPDALDAMVLEECARMLSEGISCVHEMATDLDLLASLRRLEAQEKLPLRVRSFLWAADPRLLSVINAGPSAHNAHSALLRVVGLKLFSDGALGSRGARLSVPYADGSRGVQPDSPEHMQQTIARARQLNWQMSVHAIGDAAVLDTAKLLAQYQPKGARWRIEHVQIAPWEALEMMARAGLGAAVQPIHAAHDLPWAYEMLGPSLGSVAYPWRRLKNMGLRVGFGSDHPIETPSVTAGLLAATRRRADAGDLPLPGFAETVTRAEALRCYGSDAAHLTFDEGFLGRLHGGFACDFSVWDRDLSACPSSALLEARCLATVVGGRVVWQAN
jgi:predicted amidohydrolase YtcJ